VFDIENGVYRNGFMTKTHDFILKKFFENDNVRAKIVDRITWANINGYRLHRVTINGVAGGGNLPVSSNCQLWAALLLAQLIDQHKLAGILRVSRLFLMFIYFCLYLLIFICFLMIFF
jgi:hypothetical protein